MATSMLVINAFGADAVVAPGAVSVDVGAVDTADFNEAAANPTEFIDALADGAVIVDASMASEQSVMESLKSLARTIQIARTAAGT